MSSAVTASVMGIVLAAELGAVALAAVRLAAWFVPGGDAWDRALAALVSGLAGAIAVATALGAVGLLHPPVLAIALVVAAGAVLTLVPPERGPATLDRSGVVARWSPTGTALAVVAAVSAAHYLAAGLSGRSSSPDTLQYHMPNLGGWLVGGSLWDLPFAVPGYYTHAYPSAYELTGAVFTAGRVGDELVYLAVVPWVALAVVACAVVSRSLGADAGAGALAALAVALTPLVVWTQAGALKPDVAAAAGVVAATALVLRLRDADRPVARTATLAGLALGMATASKYTAFAPAVGVVGLAALVAPASHRLRAVIGVVGGTAALTAFWLVRNGVATGNPLFPLGLGPFAEGRSPLDAFDLPLIAHVVPPDTDALRTWGTLGWRFLGPTVAFVAAGCAATMLPGGRSRRLVGALVALSLVAYACTPFTGGGPDAVALLIGSQLRYALPVVLLGAALAPAVLGRATLPLVAAALAWNGWRLRQGTPQRPEVNPHWATAAWAAVALAAVAAAFIVQRRREQRPRGVRPAALVAAVAAVCGTVGAGAVLVQGPRRPLPVETALDALGRPTGPVAVVFVHDVRALLGHELDVELVKVDAGGAADEIPILDAAALDAALDALDPPLLAVDLGSQVPVFPVGWVPDSTWQLVGEDGETSYYARAQP